MHLLLGHCSPIVLEPGTGFCLYSSIPEVVVWTCSSFQLNAWSREMYHCRRALSAGGAQASGEAVRYFGLTEEERKTAEENKDAALLGLEKARVSKGVLPRATRGSYSVLGLKDHLQSLPSVDETIWNFREQLHSPVSEGGSGSAALAPLPIRGPFLNLRRTRHPTMST